MDISSSAGITAPVRRKEVNRRLLQLVERGWMPLFSKVLVANRGEIAVRIIRACRELGVQSVAIVSEADRDCLHAYLADETVCVGGPSAGDSYLNIQNIISAALMKGCDAIHPGFGFLSENAEFAEICDQCGLTFIGPGADSIRLLGDKARAKDTMKACGVPTIPGSDGELTDLDKARELASEIGYPVLIKAAAGGGGRGIRVVEKEEDLEDAFTAATAEAVACFGYGGVYLEKLLRGIRHIEFQIFADRFGHVVYLGERDCSLQRRRQKVLEEAPSPVMTAELRARMGEAAVKAAKAVGYHNTGTVEFLLDPDGNFYFMEMNTRIQVEHPVTEMVTSLDLVKEQIQVASGQALSFTQEDVIIRGHSIECRINAENPEQNFRPDSGTVDVLFIPGGNGVRFDSQLYQGYDLPCYYDSMIGKLIVWGRDRTEAIARMKSALSELIVNGIDTNVSFQKSIINSEFFGQGRYDTGTIERMLKGEEK